jgi:hypothetical protein
MQESRWEYHLTFIMPRIRSHYHSEHSQIGLSKYDLNKSNKKAIPSHSHKQRYRHHSLLEFYLSGHEHKKPRREESKNNAHQIWYFLFCHDVLITNLFKEFFPTKMNLDNYNGFTNFREHLHNVKSNLELVIQVSNIIYKILLIMFYGFA